MVFRDNDLMDTPLECRPLDLNNWQDFEKLFGRNGACAGCWCMYWRMRNKDFCSNQGKGNHDAMQKLVTAGKVPGLLAFENSEAVAWVSMGRRSDFLRFETSKIFVPVDDQPVWSIVCFFIHRSHRRKGLMLPLIDAAIQYAASQGAGIIEAYPVDTGQKISSLSAYAGLAQVFRQAGFVEVARRSEHRPIMRYNVEKKLNDPL